MSSPKKNKAAETAGDMQLIAGIQKHLASASVTIAGTSYTGADLVKVLQTRVDAVNATLNTRAAFQSAVKAERQALLQSQVLLNNLKKTLYAMFTDVATLADFGLTPHKLPVLTPAQRIAAAAKAKATRAARHTMGSQQKKAVKGTVSSPSDPSTAGSSPAGTAAPATPPEGTSPVPPAAPPVTKA